MTRRDFFHRAAVGALTVPAALTAVSRPIPLVPFHLGGSPLVGQTIRCLGVIVDRAGAIMRHCRVIVPWTYRGTMMTVVAQRVQIIGSSFIVETPPWWARLLRLR